MLDCYAFITYNRHIDNQTVASIRFATFNVVGVLNEQKYIDSGLDVNDCAFKFKTLESYNTLVFTDSLSFLGNQIEGLSAIEPLYDWHIEDVSYDIS